MKKIFLSTMIAVLCFSTVQAQHPQREKRAAIDPEKIVQRMDRALDLTDKQEKELTALYADFYKQLKETQNSEKITKKQRKEQRLEFRKQLNEILTPKQQQKWAEVKKAQMERRRAKAEQK